MDNGSARAPLRRREDNGTSVAADNNIKNKVIIALRGERIVPNIKGLFCEPSQSKTRVGGRFSDYRRPVPHRKGNR